MMCYQNRTSASATDISSPISRRRSRAWAWISVTEGWRAPSFAVNSASRRMISAYWVRSAATVADWTASAIAPGSAPLRRSRSI
jgi:hypothetical protein